MTESPLRFTHLRFSEVVLAAPVTIFAKSLGEEYRVVRVCAQGDRPSYQGSGVRHGQNKTNKTSMCYSPPAPTPPLLFWIMTLKSRFYTFTLYEPVLPGEHSTRRPLNE